MTGWGNINIFTIRYYTAGDGVLGTVKRGKGSGGDGSPISARYSRGRGGGGRRALRDFLVAGASNSLHYIVYSVQGQYTVCSVLCTIYSVR